MRRHGSFAQRYGRGAPRDFPRLGALSNGKGAGGVPRDNRFVAAGQGLPGQVTTTNRLTRWVPEHERGLAHAWPARARAALPRRPRARTGRVHAPSSTLPWPGVGPPHAPLPSLYPARAARWRSASGWSWSRVWQLAPWGASCQPPRDQPQPVSRCACASGAGCSLAHSWGFRRDIASCGGLPRRCTI